MTIKNVDADPAGASDTISVLEIRIENFSGNPRSVVHHDLTVTGVNYTVSGPLADVILKLLTQKSQADIQPVA